MTSPRHEGILSTAPHRLTLFDACLRDWKVALAAQNGRFVTLDEHLSHPEHTEEARLVVRHDIDTAECVTQAPKLHEIELCHGVSASWYFRVDQYQYLVSDVRPLVAQLKESGHHVGLHVAPYIYRNPLDELRRSIEDFTTAFGFSPTTFTVHGYLCTELVQDRRSQFVQAVAALQEEWPHCDSLPGLHYTLMVSDSNFTPDRQQTFLNTDRWSRVVDVQKGESISILLHPCYWGDDGVRTVTGKL